jgi:hypothetical protein
MSRPYVIEFAIQDSRKMQKILKIKKWLIYEVISFDYFTAVLFIINICQENILKKR